LATGDMFIKIEGGRMGPIKGESTDLTHPDEIQVKSWSWGMRGNASATVSAGSSAKGSNQVSISELTFTKGVDSASTGLMVALRSNEAIKKAVLTVRKAGGTSPVEYLKITLEKARICSVDLQGTSTLEIGKEQVVEQVSIGFQKMSVEYLPQDSGGGKRGATSFETDISPNV
jgi:type VI secretion system secreted protein Hcp